MKLFFINDLELLWAGQSLMTHQLRMSIVEMSFGRLALRHLLVQLCAIF